MPGIDCLSITKETPKPFVWAKATDEILAGVARFCARTSESGQLESWLAGNPETIEESRLWFNQSYAW